MKIKINEEFKEGLTNYLASLKTGDDFHFLPTKNGVTETGKTLELGFSCLALKSFFILGEWQNLSNEKKENWANYINSFQNANDLKFSKNSYIDENYHKNINKTDVKKEIKRNVKKCFIVEILLLIGFIQDSCHQFLKSEDHPQKLLEFLRRLSSL